MSTSVSAPVVDLPRHRAIVVVDIEGSTMRTNPARARLRSGLRVLLDEAFLGCGIEESYRDPYVDRGDGALCLVRPVDEVPKAMLIARFVPVLAAALRQSAELVPEAAFRLRVAVHAGEVHYDEHGPYGEDVDVACRLLDAPEVKRRLKNSDEPLALVVSEEIHRAVVRHGYAGIDRGAFTQVLHVWVGGQRLRGWIRADGADLPGAGLSA
ncbi:hypothetical protein [Amycolatopsis sp. PS_44_ISF1]|uniref:hypothetical protein n=1 Tax=Amycolatopsis sp. PS_44_ISF1 TaxID=2974917 RepID=UPI0028DF0A50|nr:hypothetical protein [Amycolatopsis sp. PS_44_ISF1]MDT8913989.1 hypothetical protein [Amycolatopsis sp. PS_44_ISF1]